MADNNKSMGILAYGSLIDEPGDEIGPLVIERIKCQTPFQVEFARLSKTRDEAPTLIPVEDGEGANVNAEILVLKEGTTFEDAQNMLWRRETRRADKGKVYKVPAENKKDAVRIEALENFQGVSRVLYTSIPSNMGIPNKPDILAQFAIESILSEAGEKGLDGVRYLLNAHKNGIVTSKSQEYQKEILAFTKTKSLEDAIAKLDKQRPKNLIAKKDLADFERKVKSIADYAFQYGLKTTIPEPPDDPKLVFEKMRENREQFVINCHTGFKKAQDDILRLVMELQDKSQSNKARIKEHRRSRNINAAKTLENENKLLHFKESILRHIIDGIAWQMIGGQLYIARRLYQDVKGEKILADSNIESTLLAANSINKNERDFALISDLTGYVQIGDLLCRRGEALQIVEVKEGKHNHAILKIALEIATSDKEIGDILKDKNLDKKSGQQLLRQLNQYVVGQNLINILKTDQGVDLKTGKPIKINTPDEPTPRYDERLISVREQLETRNLWGYDVVDECLHIGMYKEHFKFIGAEILKALAEQRTKNYVMQDLRNVVVSMNRPIFMLPFPKDFIFDVLFGRIKVLLLLDLDALIELYNTAGYKAAWASRKETMKAVETHGKDIYRVDHRGIRVELPDGEMWLAAGTLLKIFFEQIYPSYLVYSTKYWYDAKESEA